MARFVFSLESVLRQRKHAEQERLRELGAAQAEMTRLQNELKALNDSMQSSAADMKANHLTGSLDVAYLAAHRRYSVAMQRRGFSLVQDMARQQRKIDDAQRLLAEAAKERKVIEKLRERQLERWKSEVGRKELAEADEVGAQWGYQQQLELSSADDAVAELAPSRTELVASAMGQAPPEAPRRNGVDSRSEERSA